MKKQLFAAALGAMFLFAASPADAQDASQDRLNSGLFAGTSVDHPADRTFEFAVGGFVAYEFAEIFSVGTSYRKSFEFDGIRPDFLADDVIDFDFGADVGPFGVLGFVGHRWMEDGHESHQGWYVGPGAHFDILGVGVEARWAIQAQAPSGGMMATEDAGGQVVAASREDHGPASRGYFLDLRFVIF